MSWTFLGNSVAAWMGAFAIAAVIFITIHLVKVAARRRGRAHDGHPAFRRLIVELIERATVILALAVGIAAGAQILALPSGVARLISAAASLAVLLQIGIWGSQVVAYLIARYTRSAGVHVPSTMTAAALEFISRLVLWSLILLLALDRLGINITALVAGLGIGGIAIALATQNILSDLFASFTIVLDKPFVIGDHIVVGDYQGSVEHIGLKTTRLRSLSGEQIIFSNAELLKNPIRNYKRMYERRVSFNLAVTYETPYDKLAGIPAMVREIVTSQPQVRFDRAHFTRYGDSALEFEVVYHVKKPDHNVYLDIQQAINLDIFRRFKDEDIEFAYPKQTPQVSGRAAEPVAAESSPGRRW